MTRIALTNAKILTAKGFLEGLTLVIEGTSIATIDTAAPPAGADIRDLAGLHLVPGFIDVQVNGGGGRLFNDDPSVETLECIAAAHRRYGTTGLLPTLISDDLGVIETAIRAVDDAIAQGVPGILGIHLEGPFLASSKKGAHRADKLLALEDEHLTLLASLRNGKTLVTLAPECATPDRIRRLVESGVVVSLGHSNADYAMAKAALDAGATGITHLFNAMSQLTSREPGLVGAAFAADSVFAGIIADGEHVHPASLTAAWRGLGSRRLMLVTDAMSLAGTDIDEFHLQGRKIFRNGDTLKDESGTLAGSVLTMAGAIQGFATKARAPLEEALVMASLTPAHFIHLEHLYGTIEPGKRANLIAFDDRFEIAATWIDGQE